MAAQWQLRPRPQRAMRSPFRAPFRSTSPRSRKRPREWPSSVSYIYIEGCLLRKLSCFQNVLVLKIYIYTNVYLWCNFVLLKLATMPRSRFSWMRKRAAWRGWRTTNHLTIDWLTASPLRSPMETTTSCASSTAAKVTRDCTRQRLAIATATRQPVPHS